MVGSFWPVIATIAGPPALKLLLGDVIPYHLIGKKRHQCSARIRGNVAAGAGVGHSAAGAAAAAGPTPPRSVRLRSCQPRGCFATTASALVRSELVLARRIARLAPVPSLTLFPCGLFEVASDDFL